jgi:hypothetical protein
MSRYKDARDKLDSALNFVVPDGPEWIKTRAAIAALDEAEVAEIARDFGMASRRLGDAIEKLRAVVAGLTPNPASKYMTQVTEALRQLTPLASKVDELLSGEPATALPGMPETNNPTFPQPAVPVVPPVREFARDIAKPATAPHDGPVVDQMIDDILRREGGFVDHPNDRGGPTNFGITQRVLASWRGRDVTRDDVRRLPLAEAKEIYRVRYFTGPKLDQLPPEIQPVVFDMSINHGPGTAIKLLQQVLDGAGFPCLVDGGVGEKTVTCAVAAVGAMGLALVNKLVDRRVMLFKAIVAGDNSQSVFLKGWLKRANEFRA